MVFFKNFTTFAFQKNVMQKNIILTTFYLFFGFFNLNAQNLYDPTSIQEIKITFDFNDWDNRLDTAKAGSETYIIAKTVEINGNIMDSVGVKYKGNSSYKPANKKNPMHLELNNVNKNQDYDGFSDIKLSNGFSDPSFVREVVSYWILNHYMHAPRANFAKVYINGNYYGLMSNIESIDKNFVSDHFFSSNGPFIKCNPVGGAGPGTNTSLPNLKWLGASSSLYISAYEPKGNSDLIELVHLIDTLNNHSAAVDKILDVDRALWMLAFNNLMVNLDSYTGAFAQNYYLYQGDNHRFSSILWDLNMSFGAFPILGNIIPPSQPLDSTAMKNLSPLTGSTNIDRPLIKNLLENPTYKRMYLAHIRTMLNEMLVSGDYLDKALESQSLIDVAVETDLNKFNTYSQFKSNLYWGVAGGSGGPGGFGTPGIVSLVNGRIAFLNGNANITAVPPAISNVLNTQQPALGSDVVITAKVTGTISQVLLGWRGQTSDVFTRVQMFDDGAHQDGAANDGFFAAKFMVNTPKSEYYVYAENADAGSFLPARAEHEFLTVETSLPAPNGGDLVINEILADNVGGQTDPAGEIEDWIELYNNSNTGINLTGLFLSDDKNNVGKWAFPSGTTISPHGFLIIWADQNGSQSGLHANFKLKASGEEVILSATDGSIVDSISFGEQITDRSFGRFVNGTGGFTDMPPTFAAQNSLTSGVHGDFEIKTKVSIAPNPSSKTVKITLPDLNSNLDLRIYDVLGKLVFQKNNTQLEQLIEVNAYQSGIYKLIVLKNGVNIGEEIFVVQH
jgi:hypothetical protein